MKGVTNYLKNVTRSIAFSAMDVAKADMAPDVIEFAQTNKDVFVSSYAALKNPKAALKKSVQAIQSSKVYQAVDYGTKNLFQDLRTGNFYNRERIARDEASLAGLDVDDWNDLSEFGVDNNWEDGKSSGSRSSASEVTAGDKMVISSIEGSNAAMTKATVNAIVGSADSMNKNMRINTAMLYTQNEKLFSGLSNSMSAINNTMNAIFKVQSQALENMDKNMSSYFTESIKLDTERNAIMKEMLEMQRNMYKSAADKEKESANSKRSNKKFRWNDISSGGMPDLGNYMASIKKNINNEIAGMGIPGFSEDSNMLASFMVSPMKYVTDWVVGGLIPTTIKQATKELNDSITGIFGNIIGMLGNARSNNDGGIMGMIAKIFGVNTSVNRTIDASKYEKGPVPFDGITRKAIIDVIPSHLRRIEAALTGKPEQMFDYDSGKWIKAKDVKKQYEDIRKNAIISGTSELRSQMNPHIKKVAATSKYDREMINKAFGELWEFLYENNGRFNPSVSASKNKINPAKYPNLTNDNMYKVVCTVFKNFATSTNASGEARTDYSKYMAISNNVLNAKDNEERQYRNIENATSNAIKQYFAEGGNKAFDQHGKWKGEPGKEKFQAFNKLTELKDEYGNSVFNYLQNVNKELTWMRLNWLVPGGMGNGPAPAGNAKGRRNRRGRSNPPSTVRALTDFSAINLRNPNFNPPSSDQRYNNANDQRAYDSAISKINKGEAVDFRDFSVDEQEALLHLAALIRDENTDEYNKRTRNAIDSNAVSKFIDKHFIRTDTTTMRDIQRRSRKADEEDKNTDEVDYGDAKEKNFVTKIKEVIGQYGSLGGAIAGAGTEAFRNVLYTADKAIYEMMYKVELKSGDKDNKKKYEGFMDMIVGKTKETFDSMKNYVENNILKPFKDKLGIGDDFKERFKNSFKGMASNAGKMFIDANRDIYGPLYQQTIGKAVEDHKTKKTIAATRDRLGKIYKKRNGLTSEYTAIDDEYKLIQRLSKAGVSSAEIQKMRDDATTEEGEFDNARYIASLNDLYKQKRSEPKWERITKSDPLATQRQRKLRYGAIATGKTSDIINWGKRNHFYSDDEHELEDRLVALKLISYEKLDKIRDNTKGADGQFDIDAYRAALIKIYNRYLTKNHAKGTMGKPFMGKSMLSKGELLFNSKGMSLVNKTDAYNINEPTHILNSEDSHDLLTGLGAKNIGPKTTVQQSLGKEKLAKDRIFGKVANNAEGTIKIDNGDINPKELIETGKKYLPEVTAGGAFGGIVGLLFGGPILGAGIGAAASLIKNSNTLKDKIFGKVGEDGQRAGGIISKATQDTVKKYLPDMAKYGLAGIIPGLLTPLGPVGGLLVGGTIGMLKNNEHFTNKYFGENGKLTIGSKEKEIIQKMFPAAVKGAGIGAIAGLFVPSPFGFLGNAVIGSAIGMMTSTDEFKEMILGVDIDGVRSGGLVGAIKDAFSPLTDALVDLKDKLLNTFEKNIIDPIAKFVTPAIHAIPQVLGIIPRKISEHLKNTISKTIGEKMKKWFSPATFLGKAAAKVTGAVSNVVTSPFRLVGAAGDAIRRKQIKTMNADYMTAEERINFMGDKASEFDKQLANMDLDKLNELKSNVAFRIDNTRALQSSVKKSGKEIQNIIESYESQSGKKISSKAREKIRKALNSNKVDQIPLILQNDGLSKEESNSLLNGDSDLKTKLNTYGDLYKRRTRAQNRTKEEDDMNNAKLQEEFKKLGIKFDPNDTHSFEKLYKYLNTEAINREANPNEKNEFALAESSNEHLSNIEKLISGSNELLSRLNENLGDNKAQEYAEKVANSVNSSESKANAKFNRTQNKALNAYGSEAANLSDEMIDNASRKGSKKQYKAAGKNNVSAEHMNASDGKINRVTVLSKLIGNDHIDSSIVKDLNRLGNTKWKKLYGILNDKRVKKYFKKSGSILNGDDLNELLSFTFNDRQYKENCNIIAKSSEAANYQHVSDVMNMRTDERENLRTTGSSKVNPVVNQEEEQTPDAEPIAQNGLGTMLLKGAGKLAGGAIKGIKSLFGGNKDESDSGGKGVARKMAGLLSMMGAKNPAGDTGHTSIGDTDETDKKGDGRDIVQTSEGPAFIERGTDGSIDYDTADSKTKEVVNKLTIKEKLQSKFMDAQLKMSESMNKIFGEAEEEKKTTKLSLLSLLFGGALLAKSGILGKIFDNVIKPLWNDHLKPWITDTAVPWIKNTLIPTIIDVGKDIVAGIITALKNDIFSSDGLLWTIFDSFLGHKDEKEATTKVDTKDKDPNEMTGMKDENGKTLTWGDIKNHNYQKLYSNDGEEIYVDENGVVINEAENDARGRTFKKVGNAAAHAFAQGGVPMLNGAKNVLGFMSRHGGIAGKIIGGTGKAVLAPVEAAGKAGSGVSNLIAEKAITRQSNRALRAAGNQIVDDVPTLGGKIVGGIKNAATNSKVGQWIQSGKDLNALKAAGSAFADNATLGQKAAGKVAAATDKLGGFVSKIIEGAKNVINKLFSNSTVVKKLKSVAEVLHVDDVAKWVAKFKDKVLGVFDDAIAKGAQKAGSETIKKVASKLNLIATIAFIIKDFVWGCDQAEAILGVADTTIVEELVSGLVNALCNLIIIPAIFPGVSTIARLLLEFFGDDLEARQKEADAEWEAYREKNGSDISKEDYLKQQYSVTGKIGAGIKKGWNTVKEGVGKGVDWVKEKAGAVKDAVVDKVKGAASAVGTVTKKVGGFIKDGAIKTIDFAKELGGKVISGDIKGLISYKAAGDEEGVLATVQNMAGNVAKVPLMVPTIVSAGIHKVADLVTGIVSKVKETGSKFLDLGKQLGGYVKSGDIMGLMGFNSGVEGTEDYSGELSKSTVGGVKLIAFIPTVLSFAVHKVADFIGNIVDGVKTAGKAIGTTVWTMKDFVIKGDINGLISYKSPEGDDFGSKVSMVTSHVAKVAMFIPTAVSAGIHKVAEIVTNVINGVKTAGAAIGNTVWTMKDFVLKGDLNGLLNYKSPEGDDFASKVSSVTANVSKVVMFVPTTVSAGIHKVAEIITNVINSVKVAGQTAVDTVWTMKDYVIAGDLSGLHGFQPAQTEGLAGGVAKVVSGIGKVVMTPPTLVSLGIHKVADGIAAIINTGKTIAAGVANVGGDIKDLVLAGDTEGLANYSIGEGDDFLTRAGNVVTNIVKTIATPAAYISKGIHAVGDKFSEIVDEIKTVKDSTDSIIEKAKAGEVSLFSSDYWGSSDTESSGFIGAIGKVYGFITKIINAPFVLVSNIFKKVADAFSNIKDWVEDKFKGVKEFFEDPLAFIYKKITGKDTGEGTGGEFVKDEDESASGTYGKGRYGRGYSKQIDPSIKNFSYNKKGDKERQTIGDSGCGPAAAVNVIESLHGRGVYGRGGSAVLNAAGYAIRNGYKETNGGTKPGFFGDYFKKHGYGSQTTSSRAQLMNNINNGMPTVLMGKDARGVSSATPFGKIPHYVTVTGTDGRGNAIVQDPESKVDNQLYPVKSLVGKSSLGISAYGRGTARYGRGVPDNDISKQVWAFFTKAGYSPAATAGILGNAVQESGVNPASIQGGGKGPAAGLFQWENYNTKSARWKEMADYAASKGKQWTDLDSQLNYALSELEGNKHCNWNNAWKNSNWSNAGTEPVTKDQFKAETNVEKATRQFEAAFERAGKPMMARRIDSANEYYKLYQDKNYTYSGAVDTNVSSGSTSGGSDGFSNGSVPDSNNPTSILGMFGNLLSNSKVGRALAAFTGGGQTSSSTSSGSSGGVSSGSSGGDSGTPFSGGQPYTGNAGGQIKKLLTAAAGEIGYHEKGDNLTKYGEWYPMNGQPWCAMFVSWAANQAGIPENIIPKYSYCPTGASQLKQLGGQEVSGANAGPGDILFHHNGSRYSHTGIVEDVSGGQVHTIEGNSSDQVIRRSYAVNESAQHYIRPKYTDTTSGGNYGSNTTNFAKTGHDTSDSNTRGGNENKPLSQYGVFQENLNSGMGSGIRHMVKTSDGYVKTEEPAEANDISRMQKSLTRKNTYYGRGGAPGSDTNGLLNTVVNILMTIADNTDKLNLIVNILNEKLGINVTAEDISNNTGNAETLKQQLGRNFGMGTEGATKITSYRDNIDSTSINAVMKAMSMIAAE